MQNYVRGKKITAKMFEHVHLIKLILVIVPACSSYFGVDEDGYNNKENKRMNSKTQLSAK